MNSVPMKALIYHIKKKHEFSSFSEQVIGCHSPGDLFVPLCTMMAAAMRLIIFVSTMILVVLRVKFYV